jgi:hypothetical protein
MALIPLTSPPDRNQNCIKCESEPLFHAETQPLAKTVATMEPIVAGYAVTRWKIAGAFALGTTLITTLGWIVSLFAGKIIAWIFSLFR